MLSEMALFRLGAPAVGLFGRSPDMLGPSEGARCGAVPDVDAFEDDFLAYLARLNGPCCAVPVRHEPLIEYRKEFAHG